MKVFLENDRFTEWTGCERDSFKCNDQFLIDKMILKHCCSKCSVRPKWLVLALEMYGIPPEIISFEKVSRKDLVKKTLIPSLINGLETSLEININRGVVLED